VRAAFDNAEVSLHGMIALRAASVALSQAQQRAVRDHHAGRVLFNEVVPRELASSTRPWTRSGSRRWWRLLRAARRRGDVGPARRAQEPGLHLRDPGRLHRGIDDVRIPPEKTEIIERAEA
jgi:hypothetical protein